MTRNIELLEKVIQHIQDDPESHRQETWWCSTGGCFAGWAIQLSEDYYVDRRLCLCSPDCHMLIYVPCHKETGESMMADGDGSSRGWRTAARLALGLDEFEEGPLFNSSNTRPMLQLMVKDLINGEELHGYEYYAREARK